MPDFFITPFDNSQRPQATPLDTSTHPDEDAVIADRNFSANLPKSGFQAVLRGIQNRCPSCGQVRLFLHFLKPIDRCTMCGQDWTAHQADDFPAYVAIFLTGHIMAPIIITLVNHANLPMWGMMMLILAVATTLMLALLQPAKGAIIAIQWWLGMHGFVKPERVSAATKTLK